MDNIVNDEQLVGTAVVTAISSAAVCGNYNIPLYICLPKELLW